MTSSNIQPLSADQIKELELNSHKLQTTTSPVWQEPGINEVVLMGEIVESHNGKPSIEVKYDKKSGIPSMVKFRLHHKDSISTIVIYSSNDQNMLTTQFVKKAQAGDFVTVLGYYEVNEVFYGDKITKFVQVVATNFKFGATRSPKYNIKVSGEISSKPNYFQNKAGQPQLFVTLTNTATTENGRGSKTNSIQLVAFGDTARKFNREITREIRIAKSLNSLIAKNIGLNLKDEEKGRAKPHFTVTGNLSSSVYTDAETKAKVYSNQISVLDYTANPSHELIRNGRYLTGTQGGRSASSVTIEDRYTETVRYEQEMVENGYFDQETGAPMLEKKLVRKSIWTVDDLEGEVDGTHAPTLSDFAAINAIANSPTPNAVITLAELTRLADVYLFMDGSYDLMLTRVEEIKELQESLNRDAEEREEAEANGPASYDIEDFEDYVTGSGNYTEEELALFDKMQDDWMVEQSGYAF
jgi:hypothetical protein